MKIKLKILKNERQLTFPLMEMESKKMKKE